MATEITRQTSAPRRRRAGRRSGRVLRAAAAGLWLAAGTAAAADLSRDDLRELEQLLAVLGFDPGPVDGEVDRRTADAIEGYQSFAALRIDGEASPALLEELRGVTRTLREADLNPPDEAPAEPTAEPTAESPGDVAGETIVEATDDGHGAVPDEAPDEASDEASVGAPPAGLESGQPEGAAVHLASFRHEAKAREEWQRLQGLLPTLLGDMVPSVREIDLGEEGLFYRLYARPFPNQATAEDFCLMLGDQGFNCRVANAESAQVAETEPGAAEALPDQPAAAPGAESEPEAESEAEAQAEADAPVPEAPATEESGAPPSPDPAEAPAPDEADAAAEPNAESAATALPPAGDSPEAAAPPDPGAGAPTALAAAEPVGRVGMQAAVGGRAGGTVGAPTLLIVGARFAEEPSGAHNAAAQAPAGRSAIGAMTDDPDLEQTQAPRTQTASAQAAPAQSGAEAYAAAAAAFESGDCAAAVRDYAQAFDAGGLSRQALAAGYNNRGRCLYSLGRYPDALDDFDRAIALDRGFAAAYYNRGRLHKAVGDSGSARADLDTAYDLGFGRLDVEP